MTDLLRIFSILPVFDIFEDKFGGVRIIIDCQSGGQLRIIISPFWTCITAKKCQKTILEQNMASWGVSLVKFVHKN